MIVHEKSKSLLLKLRPEKLQTIRTLFPDHSRLIDYQGHNLAVPHNLKMVKVLRNMGIKAPSPIRNYYNWPRPARFDKVFDHQLATADFLTLHNRCFVLNEMGCVDSETEYLSPTGWKKISQYDGGMVTQYNLATGAGELVQPLQYVKLPCNEMIRFKTDRGIDQLLSTEHRVLYWGSTGKPAVKSAQEIEARYHESKRGWSGQIATTFSSAKDSRIDLSDAELRVQVAVIADGYFGRGSNWCTVRLKKERKKTRMRALLTAAGIEYKEQTPEYESALGFSVFKFYAPWRLKEFDERFWMANSDQLRILDEEIPLWDGTFRKAGAKSFFSTSRASVDFAQYVFAAAGHTTSIQTYEREGYKTLYAAHARKNAAKLFLKGASSEGEKRANVWREPSTDGFKYCFEVPETYLVLRRNGNIFITGNTSKTASILWAADYLMHQGQVKRAVIVSPLSTLEAVWRNEIFDVCMHRQALILHGSAEKRKELLAREVDFYIINTDGLKVIEKELLQRKDIDLIIVDEASDYRNAQTSKYAVLKRVAEKRKLWLATGAPCPNAPTDAWALARLVDPTRVPDYFSSFKKQTMNQVTQYKWVPKPGSHETAYKAMQPAIRFRKADCLQLPPVTYLDRQCELTPEQNKAYTEMKNYLVAQSLSGEQITAVNAADKIGKLRQILCGAVKNPATDDYMVIPHEPRLKVLLEAIEQAAAKTLVIVPFKGIVHELKKEVQAYHDKQGDGKYCEVVNGDVSLSERNRIFQAFRDDPNLNELICHPKVMSHGLTLTQADMMVFYAPIYSSDQTGQVMDRINRPGQTKKMTIIRVYSNALEQAIYKMVQDRRDSQESMLELYRKEMQK